jgi:protocatechuate 3,4-dioxygenase beta subunit
VGEKIWVQRHPEGYLAKLALDGATTMPDLLAVAPSVHGEFNEKGEVELILSAGEYKIAPAAPFSPPYYFLTPDPRMPLATTATVAAGGAVTTQTLEYATGLTVFGQVRNQQTSEPLEGVEIILGFSQAAEKVTSSGKDGWYRIEGIPPMHWFDGALTENRIRQVVPLGARVDKPLYELPNQELGRTPAADYWEVSQLVPSHELEVRWDFEMIPWVPVEGRVEDSATSAGIPAATVSSDFSGSWRGQRYIPPGRLSAVTGMSGEFRLALPPNRLLSLQASAAGFGVEVIPTLKTQDRPLTGVVFRLSPERMIEGLIVDEDGGPIAGARLWASTQANSVADSYGRTTTVWVTQSQTISDNQGRFTLRNLSDGAFGVEAQANGYRKERVEGIRSWAPPAPGEVKADTSPVTVTLMRLRQLRLQVVRRGQPVPDVHLEIWNDSTSDNVAQSAGGTTDKEGRFTTDRVGDTTVSVSAIDHTAQAVRGRVWFYDLATGPEEQVLELEKADLTGRRAPWNRRTAASGLSTPIVVRVIDGKTRAPLEKFEADSLGMGTVKLSNTERGVFTLIGAQQGFSYGFTVSAPGYAVYSARGIFVPAGVDRVDVTAEMGPAGSLRGRVVDRDGQPIAGVQVVHDSQTSSLSGGGSSASAPQTETDRLGQFAFYDLALGDILLRFEPPADGPFVPKNSIVRLMTGEMTDMGDVVLGGYGILRGQLVRTPDNEPISGARVELQSGFGQFQITDGDGRFEFKDLRPGLHRIEAPQNGAHMWVGIEPSEVKEVLLESGSATMSGRVSWQGQGTRAELIARKLGFGRSSSRSSSTDGRGQYLLQGLMPGRWEVSIRVPNSAGVSLAEIVTMPTDGSSLTQDFELPSGRVLVRVRSATGEPVLQTQVQIRMDPGDAALVPTARKERTNDDGEVTFSNLRPGPHNVLVMTDDGRRGEQFLVPVQNSQETEVEIVLAPIAGGTVRSLALNARDSKSVPSAWLHLYSADGSLFDHTVQRGQDGWITIPGVPPGEYMAQVSALGFSVDEQAVVVESGQEAAIRSVLFPAGALRWAVIDHQNGQPIPGLVCRLIPLDPNSIETPRQGFTNDQGVFIVRGLSAGNYRAEVRGRFPLDQDTWYTDQVEISEANVTDGVIQIP